MISADTLGNMIPQIEFRIQNDGFKSWNLCCERDSECFYLDWIL